MSLKPAIGSNWLSTFATDLRHGYLEDNDTKHSIPRAYKKRLERTARGTVLLDEIKRNTKIVQLEEARLRAQEIIHKRLKQLTERRGM